MARLSRFAILAVTLLFTCASFATTYYIAANGSDSNNGTSKTTPWQHAPGMTGCSANCAAKTPQPGDQFALRGGDIWHTSAGSPTGLNWTWTWSGTAASPIYVGVDKTWWNSSTCGSSWCRPIMNLDNPLSATQVSSCAHDDSNFNAVWLNSLNYVTFDNFEFKGMCWAAPPSYNQATYIVRTGNHVYISNNYFHGWTHTNCGGATYCDSAYSVGGATSGVGIDNQVFGNVFDGSDGDGRSMYALYADCYDFHANIVRYMSNGPVCNNMHTFHDNLLEHISNSFDSTSHSNTVEFNGELSGISNYFYNNLIRHDDVAVDVWVTPSGGHPDYYFNNVLYDIPSAYWCICGSGATNVYFYNNTFQWNSGSQLIRNTDPGVTGTIYFQNNHFITDAGNTAGAILSNESSPPAAVSLSNNLFQTNAVANAQGYVASNNYAPASASGATVGAGANLTSACSPAGSSLCSDTTLGPSLMPGEVAAYPAKTPGARPSTGAWDIGAFQYNASAATKPNPPSGLTVTVH